MESVAAERLNKLGKNPSIISTRHDLKRDAAVLKDIIDRATPQVSSDDEDQDEDERNAQHEKNEERRDKEECRRSESSEDEFRSNGEKKKQHQHPIQSSFSHLQDELKKSLSSNRSKRKQSSWNLQEKKSYRSHLSISKKSSS